MSNDNVLDFPEDKKLTADTILEGIFADEVEGPRRIAERDKMIAELYEHSPVPDGIGKRVMCEALANTRMLSTYLWERLAKTGGLKGEPLRIYNGANSGVGRLCKQLGIGTHNPDLDGSDNEDDF
mgnify:CR=1 FL=1